MALHEFTVAGALVESSAGLLLVQNRRDRFDGYFAGRGRSGGRRRRLVLSGPGLRQRLARGVALGAVDDVPDPELPDDIEKRHHPGGDEDLADDADDGYPATRLLRGRYALTSAGDFLDRRGFGDCFIHRWILVSAGCASAGS